MSGKRKAEIQITKDGEQVEKDVDIQQEEQDATGNWKPAKGEVMQNRRVVKARRKKGNALEENEECIISKNTSGYIPIATFPYPSSSDTQKNDWPTFSFGSTSSTDTDKNDWPKFSFGSTSSTDTDKKDWPTFSLVSTSSTDTDTDKKELPTLSSAPTSSTDTDKKDWPTFSLVSTSSTDTDKKDTKTSSTASTSSTDTDKKDWPTSTDTDKKDWPTFSFASSTDTDKKDWPTFSFASTDTDKTDWPTFSFASSTDTEKNVSSDSNVKNEESTSPQKAEQVTPIKFPSFGNLKENNINMEWPSFTNPLQPFSFSPSSKTEASSTEISSPFKLDAPLGIFSGIGSDADKTRELMSASIENAIWGRDILPPKEPVMTSSIPLSPQNADIKLSKLDTQTTGEEGETTIAEARGRLYEFIKEDGKATWKERGTGPFKINSEKDQHRYRIIMRTDNALRVVLNAFIYSEMTLEKPNDRQIRFTCYDITKPATFSLRLTTPDNTDKIFAVMESCKEKAKSISTWGQKPSDVKSTSDATESDAVSTSEATTESKVEETTSNDAATESTASTVETKTQSDE